MSTEPMDFDLKRYGSIQNYAQRKMRSFGVTIIVTVACFGLYYLGFFGGVEGPLEGKNIGEALAGAGFTKFHLLYIMLGLFLISLTWNWCLNGVAYLTGTRRTCLKTSSIGRGTACGANVTRKRTEGSDHHYECPKGHVADKAAFHPIRKNTAAHTIWMTLAACCGILIYYM